MTQKEKAIEIPFGAKDSELLEWVYYIPEGMVAEIKDRKVIIKKAESEDENEKMINSIARTLSFAAAHNLILDYDELLAMLNWLEKQKAKEEKG